MLKPGTKLGQYEVRELIGKGGMGEVYLGHDTQLKRDVALKVLPEQFSRDSDRLARFRREAELLASLNHPNIAAIYGVYSEGGRNCLVMELVPGDTLADRILKSGPLPVDEALDIAKQICEALEHAHEKGVIHRDLKPANVKLTAEDKVKVLDFGLAKAFASDTVEYPLDSQSPTVAPAASPTIPGAILGTAAYMSPEQARGKTVDKRTDIFALGCVLYELLTGKQAFGGESVTDILGAVLHKEPDLSLLPATTPPAIRALLRRCLQKDARERLRDAADIRIQVDEALGAPDSGQQTDSGSPVSSWRRPPALAFTALVIAAIASAATLYLKPSAPSEPRAVSRLLLALPPGDRLGPSPAAPSIAISPDGSRIVYVASREGHQQLFLRELDSLDAKPMPGTENGMAPLFSPDGQSVAFYSSDKLLKVSINGGGAVTICDSITLYGASWGADDNIYFVPASNSVIFKVSAAGGVPQPVSTFDTKRGEVAHLFPEVLPGGKALIFAAGVAATTNSSQIIVGQSLQSGERRVLIQGSFPHYLPSGHLLFFRAGTMMAVPFDPVRLEVKGQPAPVLEGVASSVGGLAAQFAVSRNGAMVYLPGGAAGAERMLLWVDRKGAVQPLGAPPRGYTMPALSPDGKHLAIIIEGPNADIWIYDIPRGTLTRLTFEGSNLRPLWTPDGKRIVFTSTKSGALNIFWKPADGAGPDEQLTNVQNMFRASSLSADGKRAFYIGTDPANGQDLWSLPLTGDRKPSIFLQTKFNETVPQASPDGRWVAYISNESGQNEIYVRPYPPSAAKYQISTQGGIQPLWSRNGKELFYRNGDKTMAVDISTEPSFKAGTPHMLFEGNFEARAGGLGTNYDISPDGQRFLMIKSGANAGKSAEAAATAPTQLNVVLNWFEELKQKVPVGK